MATPTLQSYAQKLGYFAQLMSAGAETPAEADRFYALLGQVLALPPEKESVAVSLAVTGLAELGDQDSMRWLLDEIEIEAQLQYLPNARGREKPCLLFALPVVFPAGTRVQQYAHDEELFAELHEVVSEADVVDQAADFGLLPRLFSYQELFVQSYGQLKQLTLALGQQVLAGETRLVVPEFFEGSTRLEGASCSPYVDLYFIVGAVSTSNADLDSVFPALGEELIGQDGSRTDEEGQALQIDPDELLPGATADGKPWENAFCTAVENAFGALHECLTVLPPDGLPEDLRRGLELSREIGLMEMFENNVPAEAKAWARLTALREVEGEHFVLVSYVSEPGGSEVVSSRWPVLHHEGEDDALEKLMDALQEGGIELEFPMRNHHSALGSLVLH